LSGDALRIWADAAERQHTLQAVLDALDGQGDLLRAVQRVDGAIERGLAAVGLPRGLVPAVLLEAGRPRWAGLTDADSTIHLNVASLRANLAQGAPDAVFRTWVHESLHARQPVAIGGEAAVQGYEEGMVEGLTRRVLERYAGLARIGGSFEYYVAGYETLADVFGVDAEQLWRRLWAAPRGDVRARLPAAVQELRHTAGGGTLSVEQLNRLEGVAEAVFQTTRGHDRPGRSRLRELWRVALR
jgi:hypothetical protein